MIGGANLIHLDLRSTTIIDLGPLAGRRVDELWLRNCRQLRDVRPLLQTDVKWLVVPPAATNLAVLRDHPTITRIARGIKNFNWWDDKRWNDVPTKEQFWKTWDEAQEKP